MGLTPGTPLRSDAAPAPVSFPCCSFHAAALPSATAPAPLSDTPAGPAFTAAAATALVPGSRFLPCFPSATPGPGAGSGLLILSYSPPQLRWCVWNRQRSSLQAGPLPMRPLQGFARTGQQDGQWQGGFSKRRSPLANFSAPGKGQQLVELSLLLPTPAHPFAINSPPYVPLAPPDKCHTTPQTRPTCSLPLAAAGSWHA